MELYCIYQNSHINKSLQASSLSEKNGTKSVPGAVPF